MITARNPGGRTAWRRARQSMTRRSRWCLQVLAVAALRGGLRQAQAAVISTAGARLLAALALTLALAAPGLGHMQPAAATVAPQSVTFTCDGFPHHYFSVPPGVAHIAYQAAGGPGAAGSGHSTAGLAFKWAGDLTVTQGETLTITVGCTGKNSNGGAANTGGTGYGWANGGPGGGGSNGSGG